MNETVIKSCPGCFTKYVKIGGCNTMKCAVCAKKWCWTCLKLKPKNKRNTTNTECQC